MGKVQKPNSAELWSCLWWYENGDEAQRRQESRLRVFGNRSEITAYSCELKNNFK
jgi:hypothetical protein